MKWTNVRVDGGGKWILILGCPLPEKHTLKDRDSGATGPSFADCAGCPYQAGRDYEILGALGTYDASRVFPERLECGYGKS
jgi:hypothetical protein